MYPTVVNWRHLLCLFVILLLAVFSRCYNLSRNSLWTDEFLSMECSSGWGRYDELVPGTTASVPDFITLKNAKPLWSIWSSIGRDENHPPLYFVLLRLWRNLWGDSPAAIRSLSAVTSILAIVLLFAAVVVVHGPRAALWACLLMAIAIPQIQQSQDARSYMPMTAACLGAALSLVLIERSGPSLGRCTSLCLCTLAAPLLHYMAFATVVAMFIYAIFFMRAAPRRGTLLSLASAIGLYALLWGPQLLSQHIRMMDATAWLIVDQSHPVQFALRNLCTLPARLFLDLDFDPANAPIASLSAGALLLPLFFIRHHRAVLFWWIWLILPMLIALAIDLCLQRRSLAMVKYTLVAAPAVYILLGMFAAEFRRTGWIPAATIAFCCTICLPGSYESKLPDWREISQVISHTTRSGDPVVFVNSRPNVFDSDRLMSVSFYLTQQHHPLFVVDRPASAAVLSKLASTRHACVVTDSLHLLNRPLIPGLTLDRTEYLDQMALVGSVDPPTSALKIAKTTAVPSAIKHSG